jgi:hypothetical protein
MRSAGSNASEPKKVQGDRWYWDLKPDYRPGDVFEI